jgi:hypothetical protein
VRALSARRLDVNEKFARPLPARAPLPAQMQRIYLAIVALIALYMLVALIFGIPTVHVIDGRL